MPPARRRCVGSATKRAIVPAAAEQLVDYLAAGHAALGCLPTKDNIVLERFFDEAGGMQLVVHSPYGSRINRAWGLALRKRFCRKFNFELQAAATEDNIVISLTQAHSFALEEVARYLHSASVRTVLTQALLDSPMFTTRWRWVIGVALALPRFRGGRKVPPQLARMGAEDLIGAVFPDQIACAENLAGEREIPDHPLVRQAIGDSLTEAMDVAGLERLLRGIEAGAIRVTVRDLTQPSPLALEVLSARPYAYLDDAPLEERRTQAVMARRWMSPQDAADLGRLDADAVARVRSEAWPEAENADELHDALVWLGFLTGAEVEAAPRWSGWLAELAGQKRAARCDVASDAANATLWVSAERLPQFRALWPQLKTAPALAVPPPYDEQPWRRDEALVEIVRGRLEGLGPATTAALARPLGLAASEIEVPLAALEAEGFAMRGRFTPGAAAAGMVRAAAVVAHPPLHAQAAARGDRAGRGARLAALSVRLAARLGRRPDGRAEGARRRSGATRRLRGSSRRLGERDSSRHGSPTTSRAGSTSAVSPATSPGCACGPAAAGPTAAGGRRRCAPRRLRYCPGATPASGPRSPRATPRRIRAITRNCWPTASTSTARRSSTNCWRRAGCCAPRSRKRSPNWWRSVWSPPTASADCARSWCRQASAGPGPMDDGGGARRPSAWTMPAAGLLSGAPPRPNARTPNARIRPSSTSRARCWRATASCSGGCWSAKRRGCRRGANCSASIAGWKVAATFAAAASSPGSRASSSRCPRRSACCAQRGGKPAADQWVSVSGADPLNLVGILTPGPRLPALAGNRLLYRDGIPAAVLAGDDIQFLQTLDAATEWTARKALLRGPLHAPSISPNRQGEARREVAVAAIE